MTPRDSTDSLAQLFARHAALVKVYKRIAKRDLGDDIGIRIRWAEAGEPWGATSRRESSAFVAAASVPFEELADRDRALGEGATPEDAVRSLVLLEEAALMRHVAAERAKLALLEGDLSSIESALARSIGVDARERESAVAALFDRPRTP